ncbi:MAG TPA: acyl-CoA dehydrogenase, partial [Kiloniellaceae bacterium]|nr:acyl-CoA dehydrogenase [Kiloniellaceae bacterium]
MNDAALKPIDTEAPLLLPNLLPLCAEALSAAESFGEAARRAVAGLVAPGGKVDAGLLEREQFAAHGYAWLATYV